MNSDDRERPTEAGKLVRYNWGHTGRDSWVPIGHKAVPLLKQYQSLIKVFN